MQVNFYGNILCNCNQMEPSDVKEIASHGETVPSSDPLKQEA